VDEIACLDRAIPSSHGTQSSVGSSSTIVLSSDRESAATKPTSADTINPPVSQKDKGKHRPKSGYTSSLSVTYGSASEADAERGALRKSSLTVVGHWADTDSAPKRPLKGSARAKERQQSPSYVETQEACGGHRTECSCPARRRSSQLPA
jgi:hypothetical protein